VPCLPTTVGEERGLTDDISFNWGGRLCCGGGGGRWRWSLSMAGVISGSDIYYHSWNWLSALYVFFSCFFFY